MHEPEKTEVVVSILRQQRHPRVLVPVVEDVDREVEEALGNYLTMKKISR